jgi:hypothetical protein
MKKADFNMKKLWIVSVAALLAVSLTACGTDLSASSTPSASSQTSQGESVVSADDSAVEDNLAGLQKYLTANASVAGTPEEMRSDMIGAKAGVRYKYDYNGKNNVTLELYEFDTKNLNDTAKKVISDVKSTGKLTVIGQQVNAVLSNSGKYLMIYTNSATDDTNKAYDAKIKKLFTEFKAKG